jgi:hypothetical protein
MSNDDKARVLLRLPANLYQLVKAKAAELNTSINSVLTQAIERGLSTGDLQGSQPLIISMAKQQFGEAFLGLLLYGSRARGDAYETSDTDLLLVVDKSVRIERGLYRSWDTVLPSDISLTISNLPPSADDAGSLWFECALDAKVLHDPTGVIRRRLDEIKERIVSGAVIRRTTHGQGYWIAT